jgi:hypothetical protein
MHTNKSLKTTPAANKPPDLYPCLIPVLINAKKAGPKEKVSKMTMIIV